jgi:hypothetical protein
MTRPEYPTADPTVEPTAPESEAEPSFSEQLSEQLGGWRGLLESSVPVTVFVLANIMAGLQPAIIVAVVTGLAIAAYRLSRRQSIRHAMNGLFGIVLGAFIAWRSGNARDFYLPGIIRDAAYALALFASAGLRWPLVGWLWSAVLDGGHTRYRENPDLLRVFRWLTVVWALTFTVKVVISVALYLANQGDLLGIVRIALGWPPYALLLALTVWSVRRVTRRPA